MTTVTTVGYGDIGPTTHAGRIVAMAVMLMGIGFVAVLTGAAAERFMASSREVEREERKLLEEVAALRAALERLTQEVAERRR